MRFVRATTGALAAVALLALGSVPATGTTIVIPGTVVAEGQAIAFTLRPTYDSGGAAPLHLYIGYADANVLTPEPAADGQASWYNFNIAETAAFKPPSQCLPRNDPDTDDDGVPDAVEDVQTYLTGYIDATVNRAQQGEGPPPPLVPGARGLCSERFPGFAQSRYPSTVTIGEQTDDNYFDKPTAASACRDNPESTQCSSYKQYWPQFSSAARSVVRDGAFHAEADVQPSQRSEALLFGAGDGKAVSIGVARNVSSASVSGDQVVVEARSVLDDVCIGVTADGCMLRIDHIEQVARVKGGSKPEKDAHTTIVGVHGTAGDREIRSTDLKFEQGTIDFGGYFKIQAVSETHGCNAGEPGEIVADAGGFRISGTGGEGQSGGAIMVGGACARAFLQRVVEPDVDFTDDVVTPGAPPRTLNIPGSPAVPEKPGGSVPSGAPRIVTRTVTHPVYLRPIAWRTAPWWGSILGALALASALLYVFRAKPVAAPVVRVVERFARQFLRG